MTHFMWPFKIDEAFNDQSNSMLCLHRSGALCLRVRARAPVGIIVPRHIKYLSNAGVCLQVA